MISAHDALEKLREGNQRFVAGNSVDPPVGHARRGELVAEQKPFATILGCSDSRVPAEIVFNQGLGDLFVIRVAGNIATAAVIGSAEFAAESFGTPLIVVLGHSRCGAVGATLQALERPSAVQSPNLRAIVDQIRPALAELLITAHGKDAARQAVRANVRAAAHRLRQGSGILDGRVRGGDLRIVGAEYSLETGVVDFFHPATEDC